MLTPDEEKYIQQIPEDKIVVIKPFSQNETKTAEEIISKIKSQHPELEVLHMGASGLGTSGQGDLDIYALANPVKFSQYLSTLIQIFGEPKSTKQDSIAWEFEQEGYPVELYLTDPDSESMKSQIAVFKTLKTNPTLLSEYEALKAGMNGKSFRDYQKKKYEFYHKILGK